MGFSYQSNYNIFPKEDPTTGAWTGVTVTMQSNSGQPIISGVPAWYCATMAGAEALQSWLKTQGINTTIVEKWPLYQQTVGNLAVQSQQVPYLDDGKGAVENAGGLLFNWTNLPASIAEQIATEAFSLDDTQ